MTPECLTLTYATLALRDLIDIGAHLETEAGTNVAARTVAQIENYCESLRSLPNRNPNVDYADESMRVGLHGTYRIFYVVSDGIEIARIIHQSRNLTAEQFN